MLVERASEETAAVSFEPRVGMVVVLPYRHFIEMEHARDYTEATLLFSTRKIHLSGGNLRQVVEQVRMTVAKHVFQPDPFHKPEDAKLLWVEEMLIEGVG